MDLSAKLAVVTGGSGLIGQAIWRTLANNAVIVVSTYKDTVPASAMYHQLYLDQSSIESIRELWMLIEHDFKKIDILVNCAGINIPGALDEIGVKDWDLVLDTNLTGVYYMIREGLPYIRDGGAIVNVSSVSSQIGGPVSCHYAASKAGLNALTQCAALYAAKRNIRVNAVAPGYIRSPMADGGAQSEAVQETIERIPLGRLGEAEEVAKVVAFLASDAASYITGQIVNVNGGLYW